MKFIRLDSRTVDRPISFPSRSRYHERGKTMGETEGLLWDSESWAAFVVSCGL